MPHAHTQSYWEFWAENVCNRAVPYRTVPGSHGNTSGTLPDSSCTVWPDSGEVAVDRFVNSIWEKYAFYVQFSLWKIWAKTKVLCFLILLSVCGPKILKLHQVHTLNNINPLGRQMCRWVLREIFLITFVIFDHVDMIDISQIGMRKPT